MPRIRSITAAVNTSIRIGALNANRKPRHIDNGLLALSWLYRRIGNQGNARWVTVEHLQNILKKVYYNDPKRFLGPYFPRSFKKAIPELVEQGYIRWNTDKTKFRVSKQMAILCMQAASQTPGEEVDRHRAHADYFRQKISITRPTYAMVIEENKELREENNVLKGRLKDTHFSDLVREASVVTFASDEIFDEDDEPAGQDERVEMANAPSSSLSCYAPESTIVSTPNRLTQASGPNSFYPTPQSLPHARAGARPLPSSPSLGRASFSSRVNPIVDMEVDESPSSSAPFPSSHESTTPPGLNYDADIVHLAKVVNAPTSTVQSIEETYHTRISELKEEGRETREKILELTSALDKEREEWNEEHSRLVKQLEQQKTRIVCLEDELTVCKVLLDQSRENERLSAALSEEKNRLIQALSAVGTVQYQDEESHKNLWAKMLEELRVSRVTTC